MSDLHLEFEDCPVDRNCADMFILAGDIGVGLSGLSWASKLPSSIYVPGNHEFYGHSRISLIKLMREEDWGTCVFLENKSLDLGDVRFLGCTLWTDFELGGNRDKAMQLFNLHMNDARVISENGVNFSSSKALAVHQESRVWLEEELAKPYEGKTVVVTHHAPHPNSVAPQYEGDLLNASFHSDLEDLMDGVDYWIHGHTHYDVDYMVGDCRVLSRQKGYPGEKYPRGADFSPLIIEI